MEIKRGFGFLCGPTVLTAVEERVREMAALDMSLHVGLGMVREVSADGAGRAALRARDVIIEVFRRLQDILA
jgi:hypothetical protein